jgi:hypothetical protein
MAVFFFIDLLSNQELHNRVAAASGLRTQSREEQSAARFILLPVEHLSRSLPLAVL